MDTADREQKIFCCSPLCVTFLNEFYDSFRWFRLQFFCWIHVSFQLGIFSQLLMSAITVTVIRCIFHRQTNFLTKVNWLNWTNQINRRKDTKSRAFSEKNGKSLSWTSSRQGVNKTEWAAHCYLSSWTDRPNTSTHSFLADETCELSPHHKWAGATPSYNRGRWLGTQRI